MPNRTSVLKDEAKEEVTDPQPSTPGSKVVSLAVLLILGVREWCPGFRDDTDRGGVPPLNLDVAGKRGLASVLTLADTALRYELGGAS